MSRIQAKRGRRDACPTLRRILNTVLAFSLGGAVSSRADWPMLRGEPGHGGFVDAKIGRFWRLEWVREFRNERLGTAMEPIVSDGKIFVATHAGNLWALRADSGAAVWRFQAQGPFLQSPAVAKGVVVAGCADGRLYGLEAESGKLRWQVESPSGFSAAPLIAEGFAYIGSRGGELLAVRSENGQVAWRQGLGVPIRQTCAQADGLVIVTGEDLHMRAFQSGDGRRAWTSDQLSGQTCRDYYPVVVRSRGKTRVVVRTNPVLNMGQRIGRDRTFLCRQSGVDDSSWQKLDAWIKSDAARGNPDLWEREQQAIVGYLQANRDAQSFLVLDAASGKSAPAAAPVFWTGGCQGVGPQPALTRDGRLLVFYRSAYGNWNHGVAPLVALGLLDLDQDRVTPLFHQQGAQPQWNCFWGTADESQNFLVVGDTVLIIHQGTLSGFDLKKNELFPICGERDSYGGYRNPSWARNEWHGPGRSGVALAEGRLYWQTGSRILCLAPGQHRAKSEQPNPEPVATNVPSVIAPPIGSLSPVQLRAALVAEVQSVLEKDWAPLFTDPGLAGRVFSFDNSGDLFTALAWACPHLPPGLQEKIKSRLEREWTAHPPFAPGSRYSLTEGARRELFGVPREYCARLGGDRLPHPFGNTYSVWLFAERCGESALVRQGWPQLKQGYDDFKNSGWRLDPAKGDPFANRYLASLLACSRLAAQAGDDATAAEAKAQADSTTAALLVWWERAAEHGTLRAFKGSSELDPFIGRGDAFSLAVAPHRHKLALFEDLTPEVAGIVRSRAGPAAERVWQTFSELCPTWALVGEERQVHFGENFLDPPDFAMGAFAAFKWLKQSPTEELVRRIDIPFCRADLFHITKLAMALER